MCKTSILLAAFTLAILAAPAQSEESMKDIRIIVKTDKGDIEAVLYPSKAPVTVATFPTLANRRHYHRREGCRFQDFLIHLLLYLLPVYSSFTPLEDCACRHNIKKILMKSIIKYKSNLYNFRL